MRVFKDDYFFQVETFLKTYPQQIEKAKEQLNGLFNAAEYPLAEELRTRFDFKTQVMPIPHADDFRIDLAQEDMSSIKKELAKQLEDATMNAQRDLWLRLHASIKLIHETLKNPKRRWVKKTFEKLSDMSDTIVKLNFSGNLELVELAQKAKDEFAQLDLNHCKQNDAAREAAAKEAEDLLAKTTRFI